MQPCRSALGRLRDRLRGRLRGRLARIGVIAVAAGAVAGLLGGCGTSGASTAQAGTTCGRTRTGVNVPVVVKIGRGPVSCPAALRIEKSYAAAVRDGDVRGNGGGAPMTVRGWTCQGDATPDVLKTGQVSACTHGGAQILAVLPPPAATAGAPAAPPAPS